MPLMEAMACGLPSIATDWGAHQEFVTADIAYPLRIRGTIPAVAKCPYYDGFSLGRSRRRPPAPPAARGLRAPRARPRPQGQRAAAEMRERWTWRHAARAIRERLLADAARDDRPLRLPRPGSRAGRPRPQGALPPLGHRLPLDDAAAAADHARAASGLHRDLPLRHRELRGLRARRRPVLELLLADDRRLDEQPARQRRAAAQGAGAARGLPGRDGDLGGHQPAARAGPAARA